MEILRAINISRPTTANTYAFLVDEYGNSVYRFCRSLTYSKADAEDLFQETFLSVFGNLSKVSESDDPRRFLFSTALYIWKSWKRKYARRKRIASAEPLDEALASDANTEVGFMEQEELQTVRALVEALPEKYKIPTVLYYTAELAIDEIAQTLKLPAGTVKSRLFKARKLIEKGLTAYEK